MASSARLVSVPLAMFNTSSVIDEVAALRLARAISVTKMKSIVCAPSPRIRQGWPFASRSIQRIITSV